MIKARSRKHEAVTTPVKTSTVKKVSKKPSIADEVSDTDYGFVTRRDLRPTKFPLGVVSACSKIGRRQRQEDRFVLCPRAFSKDNFGFFGVFDGTVGDHASEFVHLCMMENTLSHKSFDKARELEVKTYCTADAANFVKQSLRDAFVKSDAALLKMAAERGLHYTSSTGVASVITGDLLTVGHLGDSRIVLGREDGGALFGHYLTKDHKADQPEELKRIESMGGSLVRLHGGKPFIRGGDFTERQAKGERPMQLNYSRAFGGKDLKPFGLSCEPDITQIALTPEDRVMILGSDGIWDVVSANTAVQRAVRSAAEGRDPAEDLVDFALMQHDLKGSVDNVTCLVCIFPRA